MKIRAILCDLDDTLCESHIYYSQALQKCWENLKNRGVIEGEMFEDFLERYMEVRDSMRKENVKEGISHSRALVMQQLLRSLGIYYNIELVNELYDIYWGYVTENIQLYPTVRDTLFELKKRGIKVVIISDGMILSRIKKIEALGISNLIYNLVTSEESGFDKPDKRIFELGVKSANTKKDELLAIGNNYVGDILGAKSLGIKACLFRYLDDINVFRKDKSDSIKPDFEISEFEELLKIVDNLETKS